MKCALGASAALLCVALAVATIPFEERLLLGSEFALGADGERSEMTHFKLPGHLVPQSYSLHVKPDLEKATFEGHVSITVKVETSTSLIYLNAKYLDVSPGGVKVTRINTTHRNPILTVQNVTFPRADEQLLIHLSKDLIPRAVYLVEIHYSGKLGEDMMGFYLSRYTNSKGTKKLLASTQFEPTGARRAFPCFDEPMYKTPFTIKITRKKYQKSISNMPLDTSSSVDSELVVDTFKESPKMPTYLVGFAVFEFESISNPNNTFRVWGREDVIKTQGQYIFEKGQKILAALSDYMGIDYYTMLPKMDLVAVPDFDAGAMENWGMNTYREIYLFSDLSKTKASRLEDVVSTVTHEFSHQWFGDLVTPAKWDSVWLNEAFATFFEYMGTALVEPTWRMEDLFVVEQVQLAFNSDLKGSHAMTSQTTTPESVAETFDHIIYNKGGSVLRMIEDTVSAEIFKASLQQYLKNGAEEHEGTVEPPVLWEAFDDVISEWNATSKLSPGSSSITDFTNEWVNNPGFPLVTFIRNYTSGTVTVTQRRFLTKASDMAADSSKWTIPITYKTRSDNSSSGPRRVWFPKAQESIVFQVANSSDWLIANFKQLGFYRVNYDTENWARLASQLKSNPNAIHVLNRAQILDDAFSLARAGQLDIDIALELTQYLSAETDFIPWYSVWSHVRYLLNMYAGDELGNQMKTYFIDRMDGIYKALTLKDSATEENMSKIGRSSISVWICYLGHHGCVSETAYMFRKWIQAPEKSSIPPNIKDAVYCTGIRQGSSADWNDLWRYYLKTDLASEKVAVLYALGCSQRRDDLYKFLLKITQSDSEIRTQDHFIVIRAVIGDSAGVQAGLEFLKNKTSELLALAEKDELSPAEDDLKSVISALGSSLRTEDERKQLVDFLTPLKSNAIISSTINRTLTHINERFEVKSAHQSALARWFSSHTPSTTQAPSTSTPSTQPTTAPVTTPSTVPTTGSTTPKPNSGTKLFGQISSWLLVTSFMLYVVC